MKILRPISIVALIILTAVCLYSLASYLYFSGRLNIHKVVLKSGRFELSNNEYDFTFGNLKKHRYNIILRFNREKENDPNARYREGYTIKSELRDQYNNLLMREVIDQNSRMIGGWSGKMFERYLLSFNAEKGQKYNLKFTFLSPDSFLNRVAKEIYVQEDYDYAALPWWYLFQRIFLIIFIVTLLPVIVIGIMLWRKKDKGKCERNSFS